MPVQPALSGRGREAGRVTGCLAAPAPSGVCMVEASSGLCPRLQGWGVEGYVSMPASGLKTRHGQGGVPISHPRYTL